MYEGLAVRQFGAGERHGDDADSRELSLSVRIPLVIGAATLCWLAIFAAAYAVL